MTNQINTRSINQRFQSKIHLQRKEHFTLIPYRERDVWLMVSPTSLLAPNRVHIPVGWTNHSLGQVALMAKIFGVGRQKFKVSSALTYPSLSQVM